MSEAQVVETPPVFQLFKSRAPMMGYVFRSGKSAHFLDHCYATSKEDEIKELELLTKEVPDHFFRDSGQMTATTEKVDPLASLRARIAEEERTKILLEMSRDMGSTEGGPLKGVANSSTIRAVMGASNSANTTPAGGSSGAVATKIGA